MPIGDIFYFDYGCVAFWGLTQKQEQVQCDITVPLAPPERWCRSHALHCIWHTIWYGTKSTFQKSTFCF